ncbi:MAG: hypothetical protein SPL56_07305 [Lachnospiraceae bacterium]|nr:hypothetical protein [Lachnospiraceae bacterium]
MAHPAGIDARKEGEHAGNPGFCGTDHDTALIDETEVLRRKTRRVIFLRSNFSDSEEEFEAGAARAEEGFQERIIREQALSQHTEGIGQFGVPGTLGGRKVHGDAV